MNQCRYCDAPASRIVCKSIECRRRLKAERALDRLKANAEAGVVCHCGKPVEAKALCRYHYKASRRTATGREPDRRVEVPCAGCDEPIMRRPSDLKARRPACSLMCRYFITNGTWQSQQWPKPGHRSLRRFNAEQKLSRAASGKLGGVWYVGACRTCGVLFTSDQPNNATCSKRCGAKWARDVRRARKRNAYVAPVYRQQVYARDKWTCGLCNKKLKRDAVVPHPLAPTIDHVIPLAVGGTHEPANCQAAHFICNTRKSARGSGEQLALIG